MLSRHIVRHASGGWPGDDLRKDVDDGATAICFHHGIHSLQDLYRPFELSFQLFLKILPSKVPERRLLKPSDGAIHDAIDFAKLGHYRFHHLIDGVSAPNVSLY